MKKKRKLFWLIIPVVLIGAAVGALFYFRAHPIQTAAASAIDLTKLTTTKVVVGSINAGISATGSVRTSQNATVAWSTSGKVAKVLVKKGDTVTANQILAQIDTSSSTAIINAQVNLVTAQQTLADLQNVAVSQANAQVALVQAQTAVTTAQSAIDALNSNVTQAQIDAANATYLNDLDSVARAQDAFDKVASYDESDVRRANALSALSAAKEKERTDLNTLNYLKNYKPDAATLKQDQANLALAQAKLVAAQADYDAVKNGPDAAKVAAAQANIQTIQATIDTQYIRAPFAGTITTASVKEGDLVNNGATAFRIDDMSALYIDLSVSEVDINSVKIGEAVDLTFDAIADKTYTGTVTDIGTNGSVANGVANYTVTLAMKDNDSSVRPGMTAAATIVTQEVDNALLVPTNAITSKGALKTVYILANNQATSVTVTAGMSSDTQTEITSTNLKEGDLVVTNPSSITTATTSTGASSIFASLFRSLGVTTTGASGGFGGAGGPPSGGMPGGNPPSGAPPSGGNPPSGAPGG